MSLITKQAQNEVEGAITYLENHSNPSPEKLIEYLKGTSRLLSRDNSNVPAKTSSPKEGKILHDVIVEYQESVAKEWHRKEPQVRYEEELDQPEVFQRFQEFVSVRIASIAATLFAKQMQAQSKNRLEKVVMRNTSFNSFLKLYENTK